MENREKESPSRTIDSCGSTEASMETIVDRNVTNKMQQDNQNPNYLQAQTAAMENSTNATNCNKNSLTNSQISMISNSNNDDSLRLRTDAVQHHIYQSPDLVLASEKKTIKKFREDIVPIKPLDEEGKRKLEMLKKKNKEANGNLKNSDVNSTKSATNSLPQKVKLVMPKKQFPKFIVLGIVQLVLSVSLVALGSLLLLREASLAITGSGIWSGGVAAIAGALGVINIGRSKAGFLVASLICVATSTLAMALTGTGLIRDINAIEQNEAFNIMNTEAAVSAGCGLIFALALHFLVSIISVYQSAIKLCSRRDETAQLLENIISANNQTMLNHNQHKVEEYFNSMSPSEKEKILSEGNIDKLMAMWMYSGKRLSPPQPPPVKKSRPIILVPATAGNGLPPQMLPPGCRNPQILLTPPPPQTNMAFPFPPPYGIGATPPMPGSYRVGPPGSRPSSEIYAKQMQSQRQYRSRQKRSSKMDASRRQRRKSDTDAENRKAFTYTGLDRTIADNFLERQEQSNGSGSHVDYLTSTSSSSNSDSFRGTVNVEKPV